VLIDLPVVDRLCGCVLIADSRQDGAEQDLPEASDDHEESLQQSAAAKSLRIVHDDQLLPVLRLKSGRAEANSIPVSVLDLPD
jgi:hypothetical protein